MDFLNVRKTGATYGKSTKKVLVHDLFEYRNSSDNLTDPNHSRDRMSSDKDNAINTKGVTHESIRSDEDNPLSRPSPTLSATSSASSLAPGPKTTNVFELSSSEDESGRGRKDDTNKRRRVAHTLRRANDSHSATTLTKGAKVSRKNHNDGGQTLSTQKQNKTSKIEQATSRTTTQSKRQVARGLRTSSRDANDITNRPIPIPPPRRKISSPQQSDIDSEWSTPVEEPGNADNSGHLTDQSTNSTANTPKRKRQLSQYSEDSIPSPSVLGFTSLRLTPERRLLPKKPVSPGLTSDEDETPRKVRSRLIDRLDAPSHGTDSPSSNDSTFASSTGPSPRADIAGANIRLHPTEVRSPDENRPVRLPSGEQSQTARSRTTYGNKTRTTYAKERSHLSDMADSLDQLGSASDGNSSQHLMTQRATSNLAMQLELDDIGDEESTGPGRLKSIHELRKAGANNRFDREVLSILEDIETVEAASKSVRLQALMKLVRRLEDAAFLRYILDTGRWTRLVIVAAAPPDLLTSSLFAVVFLLMCPVASAGIAPKLFEVAGKISSQLLETKSSLRKLASDRKSNLSKSMIRDIMGFEDSIVQRLRELYNFRPEVLDLNYITLLLLEKTLRRCLDLGVAVEKIPSQCYCGIVAMFTQSAEELTTVHATDLDLEQTKIALQLLEAFSIAFDDIDMDLPDKQFASLGTAMTELMDHVRAYNESFNQLVLRAVVSLSNGKPRTCQLLGRTSIIDTIFTTVDDHFQSVAIQADLEQDLDQTKLDLVILALGCLLNFAEYDNDVRTKLAVSERNGHSYVGRLVSIFNSQVSKIQEATTQEQSQVLVAVGYLSMVLCALSLDSTVRVQITQLLQDQSFAELCNAAETFLQHLRTVEQLTNEDGSVSTFTSRFNTILENIRTPKR